MVALEWLGKHLTVCDLLLHQVEDLRIDDRLMVALYIVLGNLPLVDHRLLGKEVGDVVFLKQGIALVLLVGEDARNGRIVPLRLASGGAVSFCGKPCCNTVEAHALEEKSVDVPHRSRLLGVHHQGSLRSPVIAEKTGEGDDDLPVCKTLAEPPFDVLRYGA